MFNNILLAAAVSIPVNLLCAPVLAEQITSPKPVVAASVPVKSTGNPTAAMFSAFNGGESSTPPSMALGSAGVANNIACRSKARTKLFELGARDMSDSNINSQWAIVGNMRVLVWCRETQAITSVAGSNYDSVKELRDELQKAF